MQVKKEWIKCEIKLDENGSIENIGGGTSCVIIARLYWVRG